MKTRNYTNDNIKRKARINDIDNAKIFNEYLKNHVKSIRG